jgi:arylsulfatase A-like enzyme
LSIDTLRVDEVGWYSGVDTTPFLDSLLDQSVVLTQHHSCSNWTLPSMSCFATGRFPLAAGTWPMWDRDDATFADLLSVDSLADLLDEAGFQTVLVAANPFFSDWSGLGHGFDRIVRKDWERASSIRTATESEIRDLEPPFYLHLHFVDPHQPYDPPAEYQVGFDEKWGDLGFDPRDEVELHTATTEQWDGADPAWQARVLEAVEFLYQGEVRYLDAVLGETWQMLLDAGLLDDTIVLVVSDHGEQFRERGAVDHGSQLFVEETRAIAAFWNPQLPAGTWDAPTYHPDLLPSVLELLGVALDMPVDGIPFGSATQDRVVPLASCFDDGTIELSVVRGGAGQLFYDWSGNKHFADEADTTQMTDTYAKDNPDVVALWNDLEPWVETAAALLPEAGAPVDPGP